MSTSILLRGCVSAAVFLLGAAATFAVFFMAADRVSRFVPIEGGAEQIFAAVATPAAAAQQTTTNIALLALCIAAAALISAGDEAWRRVNTRLAESIGTDLETVESMNRKGFDDALRVAGTGTAGKSPALLQQQQQRQS